MLETIKPHNRSTMGIMKKTILFLSLLAVPAVAQASSGNVVRQVNVFLGTSGDHGQMAPGAACPFGMVSVCPDSSPHQHAGYDYSVPTISGISINRVSGIGCGGSGGNLSIRPALEDEPLSIVKGSEDAHPGYYSAMLSNGVGVELTAALNMAVEKYTFPAGCERVFSIDFASSIDSRNVDCFFDFTSDRTVEGWVEAPTACARGCYRLYFNVSADRDFTVRSRDDRAAVLVFREDVRDVEFRVAVSPVDVKSANAVMSDASGLSFRKIRSDAVAQWKDKLDKIMVRGGDREQRALFYSLLYRVYLSPMMVTSPDGRYKGTDGKIYDCSGFTYYSSWSVWDSFRSKFPLLCLIDPSSMRDISRSMADVFRTGKRDWATPHESVPTVRTEHSVVMLLDAFLKGAADRAALEVAYPGMKEEAGRLPMRSPDQKMESSYDLWALGGIARILGEDADADRYLGAADSLFMGVWPSEFMSVTDDFAKMKGNGLYQGSRWQYRWAAPHFIDKMIRLEGRENLEEELEEFFSRHYFNQGNEPDIHTPFMFNLFGAPEKTQALVRSLLADDGMVHLYGGNAEYPEPFVGRAFRNAVDGLAPEMDEDDGTMSAWYVFCSMGFYPVVVGSDVYEVFSPLYDRIRIRSGESSVTIRTKGRKSPDDVIRGIEVNGRPVDGYGLPHSALSGKSRVVIRY